MYDDVLQAVIDMAAAAAGVPVFLGSMPPDNGLAMTGQASTDSTMLDIGANWRMNVVLNGKNSDQQTVVGQLDTIHAALTRRKDFPHGDGWQIYAIETVASPRLISRGENPAAQWVYGSSLLVKINIGGI